MKNSKIVFISLYLLLYLNICSQVKDNISTQLSTQQGQTNFPKTTVSTDINQLLGNYNEQSLLGTGTTFPVEGTIDAAKYIVGQGDIFSLGIYGYLNQILPVSVNLEGSVIIPTVGEIKISGLTLKDAKDKVIANVKKRYYSSDVSFTLSNPRTFLIQVTGLSQGTYTVTFLTRVSQLIPFILSDTMNVSKKQDQSKIFPVNVKNPENPAQISQISLRNIELKRKDGTINRVDLYKFFMTKNDSYNPTFLEGDLLKLYSTDISKNCVSVHGAVQIPGTYEYVSDDDLETVIGLGRGFDGNAEPDSIMVFRPYGQSSGFNVFNLSYEKDKNFKINVFDRVFVKYKTDYQKMIMVNIQGEVLRPGLYPIAFKKTRVKDIIEMAGGFTQNAYLPLCILFRNYDQEYLAKDTLEMLTNLRANDLIVVDKDKLNFEGDIRTRRNRVNIDFVKLFESNDEKQNVILEDKDLIYINDDKKVVYVYGQVQNEGFITYKKGEDVEYYIQKAGGYSLAAEKGDTRVIKYNSRGWYKPNSTEVESGDFIYVPKVVNKSFTETISLVSQIAGVILGVLTTYILIKNTSK